MKKLVGYFQKLMVLWTVNVFAAHVEAAEIPRIGQVKMGTSDLVAILGKIIDWVLGFAGGLAVLFIIYGGIIYITGAEKGAERGKTILTNAIIGLAIIILSAVIVNWVASIFNVGTQTGPLSP